MSKDTKTITLSEKDRQAILNVCAGFIELQTHNFLIRTKGESPSDGTSLRWMAQELLKGYDDEFNESNAKYFIENAYRCVNLLQ